MNHNSGMPSFIQHRKGRTPRSAHKHLDGLKDEELGRRGFQGRQAQLYRVNDPTKFRPLGRLRHTEIKPTQLVGADRDDPDALPQRLFHNDDCQIFVAQLGTPTAFYRRNLDGDEVHFVHRGTGTVETEFGPLTYRPGDYVVIPRAITHRWVPDDTPQFRFVCETVDELVVPDYGLLGRHTPFDPTVINVPDAQVLDSTEPEYEIRCRVGGRDESIVYPHNPCDVAGWKGDYFPWSLNIDDWNVVMSDTLHLVPTIHAFLQARGVWVVHFLPRPLESEVGVERMPYYHRNADYDEVTLIHGGSVFGQDLPAGVIGHDPQGLHHGVPEEVREFSRKSFASHDRIEWQIISIDTERPLHIDPLDSDGDTTLATAEEASR